MTQNANSESIPKVIAYVTDNEDEKQPSRNHRASKSKRVMAQRRHNDLMAFLVAHERAAMPYLTIKSRKITRGFSGANMDMQLNEWSYEGLFAGAVVYEDTGETLEYRDLIKKYKHRKIWNTSLANELERLSQGIRDVEGTITNIYIYI